MNTPESLLGRLAAIGASLSERPGARALLALGSVGRERDRLDAYSDLDFFAIVGAGRKSEFLDDLSWLSDVAPVVYCFRNTGDGYKLLYADSVFCEFAVFEEAELETAVYAPGELVWKADGVNEGIAVPKRPLPEVDDCDSDWLLGEALTNLYVGLMRDHRGEHLSAMRFIQVFAVDRVIDLFDRKRHELVVSKDPFNPDRRVEQRLPELKTMVAGMSKGYSHNRASALAILEILDQKFCLPDAMATVIRELCIVPVD